MEETQIELPLEILSITEDFAAIKSVRAVALAGSRTAGRADAASDFDLYVYADKEIPPALRRRIACKYAARMEIDNRFFEPGDEWLIKSLGLKADIMYRSPAWVEEALDRVLVKCEASTGYTTCFLDNVQNSVPLFDRKGWFGALQRRACRPYPARLGKAIIAKNLPLLNTAFGSFESQMRSAFERGDAVAVNHRLAAFLASYFDVLFAVNGLPHPGEKRLMEIGAACARLPRDYNRDMKRLFSAGAGPAARLSAVNSLADNMRALVAGLR